jgi:hypothetical protein
MSSLEKIVVLKLNDKKDEFTTVPVEMQDEVIKKIGSEFRPKTRDCIRGLTPEQERVILPNIIGLQPSDQQFPMRTRDFWADFSVVPDVDGIRLNIATEKKRVKIGNEETELDMPVNEEDYMIYQFCMQSSKVAKTENQLKNLSQYDFYIVNLEKEREKEVSEFKLKKDASIAFARLVSKFEENEEKINWILTMLKEPKEFFSPSMEPQDKEMLLSKKQEKDASAFLKVVEDKDLEQKAFLATSISNGILTLQGNDYFYGDDNLGPEMSAISKLKSSDFSSELLRIKARLEGQMDNIKN